MTTTAAELRTGRADAARVQAQRTQLENLHGELLHEAASLAAAGNHYASSLARARAATIGNELGWGSC